MTLPIGLLNSRVTCVGRSVQRFLMDGDVVRVGRAPTLEIVLDDPSVSSRHCRLVRRDGCFMLMDDGSASGMLVNGDRVADTQLRVGDVVQIGHTVMVFEHRSEPDVSAEIHPLLAAVYADPANEASRSVYADWLGDRGDPRGAFIQYQLEAERLPVGDRRRLELGAAAQVLLNRYEHAWVTPLPVFVENWRFRRGFIAAVRLDAQAILDTDGFAALRRAHPIRSVSLVELTMTSEVLEELVHSPNLAGVQQVELNWWRGCEPGAVHPGLAERFGCGERPGIYGTERAYFP